MFYASAETPGVSDRFVRLEEKARYDLVRQKILVFFNGIWMDEDVQSLDLVSVNSRGEILVKFLKTPPASKRGPCLLGLEKYLKTEIDDGIVVWHAALGDKNSLRKLRGVTIEN